MHTAYRYAVTCSLVLLIAAMGCGKDSDSASEKESSDPKGAQSSDSGGAPVANAGAEKSGNPAAPAGTGKPRVVIKTTLGDITVELTPERAGVTVGEFLDNARRGYYDDTIFHEVMKDYVVIGGSFTENLEEKEKRSSFHSEARDGLSNVRGTIAMSRQPQDKSSATCQFFFNLADNSDLLDHKKAPEGQKTTDQDWGYTVFGEVIDGMAVVDAIGNVQVEEQGEFEQIPAEPIKILSMREL